MSGPTLAAVFFLVSVLTAIAPQKPDFSGEWTLNLKASTLSPAVAPAAQSGVLQIEHHEPKFTGHLTIVLDGKPFESKFELLSDGREVATTDDRGRQPERGPAKKMSSAAKAAPKHIPLAINRTTSMV